MLAIDDDTLTPTARLLLGLVAAIATSALGVAIAALLLPPPEKRWQQSSTRSPAESVSAAMTETTQSARRSQPVEKVETAPAEKVEKVKQPACRKVKASDPSPRGSTTASSSARSDVQRRFAVATASVSAPPSQPAPSTALSPGEVVFGGELWMVRAAALRRCGGGVLARSPKLIKLAWSFIDDRPSVAATGCADGQARIFDLRTGRMMVSVRHDTGSKQPLNTVRLTLARRRRQAGAPELITGSWDGKWHTWESWPSKPERPSELARGEPGLGHENKVTGIAVSRDGLRVAVACTMGRVLIFRCECPTTEVAITDPEEAARLRDALALGDHGELYLKEAVEVGGIHLDASEELLKEASFHGKQSRRDLATMALPARLLFRFTGCMTRGHKKAWRKLEHDGAVRCLGISAEGLGEFLYSGSRDRSVKKWDLEDGSLVHCYQGHVAAVRCLAVNSAFLVSGGDDRSIRVWRKDTPELLRSLAGHSDFVLALSLCPTYSERLVSSGEDRKVILWDVANGCHLREFCHGDAHVAAVLLYGSLLLTAASDSRMRVWNVDTANLERQVRHAGAVTAVDAL